MEHTYMTRLIEKGVPQLYFDTISEDIIYNELFAPIERNIKFSIQEPITLFAVLIMLNNIELKWKR